MVAQDDDDEKDDRRRQKLRTLTSSNYDAWDNDLDDLAYSKDWEDVYDYALPADGNRNAAALVIEDEKKKKMWGVIKASLDDDMKDVVMDVARGDVVALLRELRDHFYKHNSQNSDRVRKQIHECHLSDYKDINAYLSRMKRLIRKAEGFGGAWAPRLRKSVFSGRCVITIKIMNRVAQNADNCGEKRSTVRHQTSTTTGRR